MEGQILTQAWKKKRLIFLNGYDIFTPWTLFYPVKCLHTSNHHGTHSDQGHSIPKHTCSDSLIIYKENWALLDLLDMLRSFLDRLWELELSILVQISFEFSPLSHLIGSKN